MGRQIRFFATASDFHQLLDIIYSRGAYVLDHSGNKLSLENIKENIFDSYTTENFLHHFYIVKDGWRIAFSNGFVNQLDSEAIEVSICRKIPEKTVDMSPVHKHFQINGYTVISDSDKYFELLREYEKNPIYIPNPQYVENGYEHGRFWCPSFFYDADSKSPPQSKAVTREFNALVRVIKKLGTLSDDKKTAYILPDAFEGFKNKTFIPRSGISTIEFSKKGDKQ